MLGWIVSIIVLAAGIVTIKLVRKNSTISAILFGIALFIMSHFIFDTKIDIRYTTRDYPDVYLLVDRSASCGMLPPSIAELAGLAGNDRTYYFADTISKDANSLNPQFSLVFDSLKTLMNKVPPGSKIILVSDFLDNSSIGKAEPVQNTFPLVMGNTNDSLSIYSVTAGEYIQGGEPILLGMEIYSDSAKNAAFTLTENGKPMLTKTLSLKAGINPVKIPYTFQSRGYRTIGFNIQGADILTNNNSLKWVVNVMPSYYKILVAAGKPSAEFAALKRFLDKIRWITPDYVVLKSKNDTYSLAGIEAYNGIILMDFSDYQLDNIGMLKNTKKKVFYEPGLKGAYEIVSILDAVRFKNPLSKPGETKFLYNGQELVVKTWFGNDPLLFETAPNIRIFLGWDTWKWDFMSLAMGISLGIHSDFWRNQLNFIIGGGDNEILPDKLNYIAGMKNPVGTNLPGIYNITLKGKTHPISVALNPTENSSMPADISAARTISSNTQYLSAVQDIKDYYIKIRGNEKLEKENSLLFTFRNNPVVFFALLTVLALFWILKDSEDIKR